LILEDTNAVLHDVEVIEYGGASPLEKTVARKLSATLAGGARLAPDAVPADWEQLPLGDAQAESAKVGWLTPAANRVPASAEVPLPFLDSGGVYPTGLYAHSPSRYMFKLGGQWQRLRGAAGLHTAFQNHAYGVVFVIKADGREVFRSGAVQDATHAQYDVDVTGVKTLELIVEQAQAGNGGDWGLWLEPTLFRKTSPK
jgi:hypothetical protein